MYEELRSLARRGGRNADCTLSPTEVVHEAYLRCCRGESANDANHLRAKLVTAMRHILVDRARRRQVRKRGEVILTLRTQHGSTDTVVDVLTLDEVLGELSAVNERMGRIAELRVLGGLTLESVAELVGVGIGTASKDWQFARAWLARRLHLELATGENKVVPETKS